MTTINPTHREAFAAAQQAHGKALRLASAIASKLQVPDPIKALLGVSPVSPGLPQDRDLMEAVAAMNKATAEQTAAVQAHAGDTGVSLQVARLELMLGRLQARRKPLTTGIAPIDAAEALATGDLLLIHGDAAQRVQAAILDAQPLSVPYTSALTTSTKADYLMILAAPDTGSAAIALRDTHMSPRLTAIAEEAPDGMVVLTVETGDLRLPVLIAI